jgi:hypothetical protein
VLFQANSAFAIAESALAAFQGHARRERRIKSDKTLIEAGLPDLLRENTPIESQELLRFSLRTHFLNHKAVNHNQRQRCRNLVAAATNIWRRT